MAALVFPYNHSRDPMHPGDVAFKAMNGLGLTSLPVVDIGPSSITITHASITETNRATIQTQLNAYVLDPDWQGLPPTAGGVMLYKARRALVNNATFLAIASPSNAEILAQVRALTRQVNALVRIVTNADESIVDT